jgi:hypothetical protein
LASATAFCSSSCCSFSERAVLSSATVRICVYRSSSKEA